MVAYRYEEVMRNLAVSLCPDLKHILLHDSALSRSTWAPSVETGKALELLTLCGLVRVLRDEGASISFPEVYFDNPDLFFLRNTLPRHHDAQAGHGSAYFGEVSLKDRFVAALTPKAVVCLRDGSEFMLLREGYPLHLIDCNTRGRAEYLDRPDIILANGSISVILSQPGELDFSFVDSTRKRSGKLRIKNDINIPLISYESEGEEDLRVGLFVECSVNKVRKIANDQRDRYTHLFSPNGSPVSVLVNGSGKVFGDYSIEIAVSPRQTIEEIEKSLLRGLRESLDLLSNSKGT